MLVLGKTEKCNMVGITMDLENRRYDCNYECDVTNITKIEFHVTSGVQVCEISYNMQ